MSYADTVYAQMLNMQMSAANQWAQQAEQEKLLSYERQAKGFDQFQNVMEWLLKAQQQKHVEEMDMAKMAGAGEGITDKPSGMSFSPAGQQMAQAARFATKADLEKEVIKERREKEWWNQRYGIGGINQTAKLDTKEKETEILAERLRRLGPITAENRAEAEEILYERLRPLGLDKRSLAALMGGISVKVSAEKEENKALTKITGLPDIDTYLSSKNKLLDQELSTKLRAPRRGPRQTAVDDAPIRAAKDANNALAEKIREKWREIISDDARYPTQGQKIAACTAYWNSEKGKFVSSSSGALDDVVAPSGKQEPELNDTQKAVQDLSDSLGIPR